VTASSFQFAARRLRVLLRGVFHFKFATLISVIVVARARARVQIRAAGTTQALASVTASQSHRQNGQNDLPREIRHVEASVHEDVAFTERVVGTIDLRVETLPDIDFNRPADGLEASVAIALGFCGDRALDQQNPVGALDGELDVRRSREGNPLERLHRDVVFEPKDLAVPRQEALDIDGMRTCHMQ
jgi:hypothetical protein